MTDREIDAAVAERVLGWKLIDVYWFLPGKSITSAALECPKFLTDASADYQILCHVREKWEPPLIGRFKDMLGPHPMAYVVGDYARAALKAIGIDTGDEA